MGEQMGGKRQIPMQECDKMYILVYSRLFNLGLIWSEIY